MRIFSSEDNFRAEIGVDDGSVTSVGFLYPDGVREIFMNSKALNSSAELTDGKFTDAAKRICRCNPSIFKQLTKSVTDEHYQELLKKSYQEVMKSLQDI